MASEQRRTNRQRRGESEEKILDAAQALFAKGGFNGVSLKDIAQAASVDTSLLHYYFTTKAGLFAAVVGRHAQRVNEMRLSSLRAYEAGAGDRLTVEGVLRAYLEPIFEFVHHGAGAQRDYLTVISQLISAPVDAIPGAAATPFDPVIQVFIGLLKKASPNASDADVYWFYHMLSGAIGMSWARTGRIDRISGGLCRSDDFLTLGEHMIAVFAHGLDSRGHAIQH